jgi:S1-C subfamily serine protease
VKPQRILHMAVFGAAFLLLPGVSSALSDREPSDSVPISTKWLLDAAGPTVRSAVTSLYMIVGQTTQEKGSAFLLDNGWLVTNHHVVKNNAAQSLTATSSLGKQAKIKRIISDPIADLALLEPDQKLSGGLSLGNSDKLPVGVSLSAWGYPLGYNGPAPLLSVGYLAGFAAIVAETEKRTIKHLVINGAFNPGNSGGPLIDPSTGKVVGVVVSKHAPVPQTLQQILKAFTDNKYGMMYTFESVDKKEKFQLSEAQLVAQWLTYFHQMTQVVIGEAIAVEEVRTFIDRSLKK